MNLGKWIGGALGFITGGPLGILAGIILGSLFDAGMEQLSGTYQQPTGTSNTGERNSFLFSLLVMASYIMKADGKVMHSEMEYVRRFLRINFGEVAVGEGEEILLRLFEERKRRERENPQAFKQIIRDCGGQIARNMSYEERLQLLAFLAEIAKADGRVVAEEIEALRREKIEVSEIPGITSAVAVPAAAGIPVTNREMSRSFHVVTAHTSDTIDGLPEELETLAKLGGTCVFLMGLHRLGCIAEKLLACGKSPDTPAAVVHGNFDGTVQAVRGTLADIAQKANEAGIETPAVIVVGETAGMELFS